MTVKRKNIGFVAALIALVVVIFINVLRSSMTVEFEGGRTYEISFSDSNVKSAKNCSSVLEIDSDHKIGPTFNMEVSLFNSERQFLFGHLDSIDFPTKFPYSSKNEIEEIDQFRIDKDPIDRIFYYSNQNDLYALNIYSIYVSREHCWEEIQLVIFDSNDSLVSTFNIAKNAGCGTEDEHKTIFLSDSIFTTIYYPKLGFEYLDIEKQIGIKYSRISESFLIKPNGRIEEISSSTDTLTAPRKYKQNAFNE